jgi:outer membrane protein assembly factor BamD (BamD/ComL family)
MARIVSFALLAAVFCFTGCLSASVKEETDPYRDEPEYSREVSFSSLDRFEEAQHLVQQRDFEAAIAIYRNLYQTSTSDEDKARALLEWAHAERSPFNPDRDPDAAKARLELLVETYPDSEFAVEAVEELDGMGG